MSDLYTIQELAVKIGINLSFTWWIIMTKLGERRLIVELPNEDIKASISGKTMSTGKGVVTSLVVPSGV